MTKNERRQSYFTGVAVYFVRNGVIDIPLLPPLTDALSGGMGVSVLVLLAVFLLYP